MFVYAILPYSNSSVFFKICSEIESAHPELQKQPLLSNTNGVQVQTYRTAHGQGIAVYNDTVSDAVYVNSEIALPEIAAE